MPLIRISLTIAADLVKRLDRRAKELDRSRSWLIGEAVRQFLAATAEGLVPRGLVREPAPASYEAAAEVAAARRLHLQSDLRLPPEERLRRAEALTQLGRSAQRRQVRDQIIGFQTYEDYYQWKKARLVGG